MLLLGAVLALLAFFVLYLGLSRASPPPVVPSPTAVPQVNVLVPAKDIPSFTMIMTPDITIKQIDETQVLTGTAQEADLSKVVGHVFTRAYVQGSVISLDDVVDPGISQVLPKGKRGFVLPVLEVNNFGGQLNDNDSVDILWTRQFEIITQIVGADGKPVQYVKPLPTTKLLLSNIKVVRVIHLSPGTPGKAQNGAVNTTPEQSSGGNQAQQQQQQTQALQGLYGKDAPINAALVLAVEDKEAEVIKFAREYGVVDLALRAKDDTDVQRTTGITDKILIDDYGVVIPELIIK